MITFDVNGRTYNIRDYMTVDMFDMVKEDETEQGMTLLFVNMLDADGNPFADMAAMKHVLPLPDIAGIRQKIWQANGLNVAVE